MLHYLRITFSLPFSVSQESDRSSILDEPFLNKLGRCLNFQYLKYQGKYLKQMEDALEKGLGYASQELIDSIGIKLARLYDEQAIIESELQNIRQEWDLCA